MLPAWPASLALDDPNNAFFSLKRIPSDGSRFRGELLISPSPEPGVPPPPLSSNSEIA